MAKSTKHRDKIAKSVDDFKAPWETDSGTDAEIEKAPLRRLIYNLKVAEAVALDAADDAKAALAEAEERATALKDEVEKASPEEANRKISRLEAKNAELAKSVKALTDAKDLADLRAEVLDGLEARYAKYVTGEDREALEKSLADVRKDFGLEGGDDTDDEDDRELGRNRPRPGLRNPSDPNPDSGNDKEFDFDKEAGGILGDSLF